MNKTKKQKKKIFFKKGGQIEKKKTYYKIIKGERYDKNLLDKVNKYISSSKNNTIDINVINMMINEISNGGKITKYEANTLEYIKNHHKITEKASIMLNHLLKKIQEIRQNNNNTNQNNNNQNNQNQNQNQNQNNNQNIYLPNKNTKAKKMKNYYSDLTGSKLYKKILDKYNALLVNYDKNNDNELFEIINFAVLGALLDLYGGKPTHYDTVQNRKKRLVEGLKLFDDDVYISYIPHNYYDIKNAIDEEGIKEDDLTTFLALNQNVDDEDFGEILYLGNWENPIGNNNNCLRELLSAIRNKNLNKERYNHYHNIYDNKNNENLDEENTVMNYDDDYYEDTGYNYISFNNDEYKYIGNYILIVVNGISVREEPAIGQFLNGNIFIDKDFFKNPDNIGNNYFKPQYYTQERGVAKDPYFVYKYTH